MKNKKSILLIISLILLIIGLVCVCLFFSFGKNEKVDSPIDNEEEVIEIKDGYDEFGNKIVVVYKTKEEVYDVIVNNYLSSGETISPAREENGCWYYKSSNGIDEYEYCIEDPVIRVNSTYTVNIYAK